MAQQNTMKTRALVKDEILFLLDLISKQKVITTKATNATNNKLKEEAWKSIAQEFSAMAGELRRPEQLRLKWENLKKSSRKRNALIRQNNLKTGGGKMYIPPDEALDRVTSMLGATCTGFTVEFGGDGESEMIPPDAVVELMDLQPLPEHSEAVTSDLVMGGGGSAECGSAECGGNSEKIFTPKRFTFNNPYKPVKKRQKPSEELLRAQISKELAMAAYFEAKTEVVKLEKVKLQLEIEKLNK
ncbi:unnamed protein product [Parnassius apollo]|uniref:Regulatory protein zeste n=1 Tax=Parnassius apollo TaxID=110799 RepID=A0A8S3XA54_PARAO|nr:unnamed protein product [Parnassius apollo]CAG5007576.1 unnamed protein product [Parnassius apollo]